MNPERTPAQYKAYRKPSWAPPSWVFGPVWSVLYLLIAISFGYVAYLFIGGNISFWIVLPFLLNLIFNAAYTLLQFRYNKYVLASLDEVLVAVTLLWAQVAIFPTAAWVSYLNIPYLAWVCFASVLQITITVMNGKVVDKEGRIKKGS